LLPHFLAPSLISSINPQLTLLLLQHLTSYPVISDSITSFKTNPYGAKSLSLTSASLAHLQPILPYLARPYSLVSPYIQKADSLGDSTLSSIDARFPLVKKPTGELYSSGRDIVLFPLRKGSEGRDYVLGVFSAEKKTFEQEGVVGYGRAIVGTGVVVGGEAYRLVTEYLIPGSKKGEKSEK
jgi:hypothetical protein